MRGLNASKEQNVRRAVRRLLPGFAALTLIVFGLASCGNQRTTTSQTSTSSSRNRTSENSGTTWKSHSEGHGEDTQNPGADSSDISHQTATNPFMEQPVNSSAQGSSSISFADKANVKDLKSIPEKDRKLSEPELHLRQTLSAQVLDPQRFRSKQFQDKPMVPVAYEIAKKHPDILVRLFCYCGCDLTEKHITLLDCFTDKDEHGATCSECIDEAFLADQLYKDGANMARIQQIVDEQFCTKYPFSPSERTATYKKYLAKRLYTDSGTPICGDDYSKE